MLELPQIRPRGVRHARYEGRGKLLLLGVVLRRGVVVELARERNPVLRGRQLFLQLADVAGRFELRVALDCDQQPRQSTDRAFSAWLICLTLSGPDALTFTA